MTRHMNTPKRHNLLYMNTLKCFIGYTINIASSNGKAYEDTLSSTIGRPWMTLKMITI